MLNMETKIFESINKGIDRIIRMDTWENTELRFTNRTRGIPVYISVKVVKALEKIIE